MGRRFDAGSLYAAGGCAMIDHDVLEQNRQSWNAMADTWFGSTALPTYGCLIPTEDELRLFPDLRGKKVLDIGCGSGHSLKWCADNGAAELWGLDISSRQIDTAQEFLRKSGYRPTLLCAPMEADCGLPKGYFDVVYSIYALGWSVDLKATLQKIASYIRQGGTLIFSWDHPILHCVSVRNGELLFDGCYLADERFSYMQRGYPVTVENHKMSSWLNALADAGFMLKRLVEETEPAVLGQEHKQEFSSGYYSPDKARKFPLSFIVQAVKL